MKFYFRWTKDSIREDFKVVTKFPLLAGTRQPGWEARGQAGTGLFGLQGQVGLPCMSTYLSANLSSGIWSVAEEVSG